MARAVGVRRFGGPEVLEVLDVAVRAPGPGEVRLQVQAAAVNPTDLGFRAGSRAAQMTWDPPYVLGMDAAGVVDAVGAGVELAVGSAVMAVVSPFRPDGGAQSELVVVPAASVVTSPAGTSAVEAATLPMNGVTAKVALDLLELVPGATLAVTGAAGVLGSYVIPLAVARGLHVVADAKPDDESLVRSFGAHDVVARGEGLAGRFRAVVPEGVDGLVDAATIGGPILGAVRDGGRVAAVRAFGAAPERDITVSEFRVSHHVEDTAALREVRDLVEAGSIVPRVAGVCALEEAADAHRRLAAGGLRGRLVLSWDGAAR